MAGTAQESTSCPQTFQGHSHSQSITILGHPPELPPRYSYAPEIDGIVSINTYVRPLERPHGLETASVA